MLECSKCRLALACTAFQTGAGSAHGHGAAACRRRRRRLRFVTTSCLSFLCCAGMNECHIWRAHMQPGSQGGLRQGGRRKEGRHLRQRQGRAGAEQESIIGAWTRRPAAGGCLRRDKKLLSNAAVRERRGRARKRARPAVVLRRPPERAITRRAGLGVHHRVAVGVLFPRQSICGQDEVGGWRGGNGG